ncbi:lung seven transmembrane receptor-domain-containing protein [Auriculariales sp. MPI-PUGE-AT-0066]|nr:lung seven transmembrane receptor-domain-containing protein [Auriculariales sp. MPI-PUGE-AT-0066]
MRSFLQGALAVVPLLAHARAFQVPIVHTDDGNQVCSGMWGGSNAFINLTFDASSEGQLAAVIYEWDDVSYLGRASSDPERPAYVCTSPAVLQGICSQAEMGRFLLDLPPSKKQEQTSIWSASIAFHPPSKTARAEALPASGSTTDSAAGMITSGGDAGRTLYYKGPIQYAVRKTGYYCIATIPFTTQSSNSEQGMVHGSYSGVVNFQNVFDGMLAATDYPKIQLYLSLFLIYLVLGGVWGFLCYKHRDELLQIQHYISALVGFCIVEMVAHWAYYRYLNAHGGGVPSVVFLVVVAILDAARNALSFLLLLIVSLGMSVVRPELDRVTMRKCQLLAGAHFLFGVLYAIGIVELQLESTSGLILLLFVIPLAFTLSTFLLWIMYALNGTIAQLAARKQRFKLGMFKRLYWTLVGAVVVIMIFFVVSSMAFSNRLAEDYAANSWQYRWWFLDAWLAFLYLGVFTIIAFFWRPSEHNMRLAMSDEIAQDEEEAEDYDAVALEDRHKDGDADEHTLVDGRRGAGRQSLGDDGIVFEIGDGQDSDDDDKPNHKHGRVRLPDDDGDRR